MAQAEAEYKDFELFYPTMEESAEAQYKICMIHYKEMDKADRDPSQALRAEDECRQLMVQYPNSKHAPQTAQLLRNIQEVLAGHEFGVGISISSAGQIQRLPTASAMSRINILYSATQIRRFGKLDAPT